MLQDISIACSVVGIIHLFLPSLLPLLNSFTNAWLVMCLVVCVVKRLKFS